MGDDDGRHREDHRGDGVAQDTRMLLDKVRGATYPSMGATYPSMDVIMRLFRFN